MLLPVEEDLFVLQSVGRQGRGVGGDPSSTAAKEGKSDKEIDRYHDDLVSRKDEHDDAFNHLKGLAQGTD